MRLSARAACHYPAGGPGPHRETGSDSRPSRPSSSTATSVHGCPRIAARSGRARGAPNVRSAPVATSLAVMLISLTSSASRRHTRCGSGLRIFKRNIVLPASGEETFFLWGPRQTGKSTLLRERFPGSRWLDLLRAEEFRRYAANPEFLRQEIEADGRPAPGDQIVIDEIQKVPALLDEVHWLIENRRLHFTLCGSSARKVRRGAANLLGGRAVWYELQGLTEDELGDEFDLSRMLNHGYLPRMYEADGPARRSRPRSCDSGRVQRWCRSRSRSPSRAPPGRAPS